MAFDYKVVDRFKLNGTIDRHDPTGVTVRIFGGDETFLLTLITANLGRGYRDAQHFKNNVWRILIKTKKLTKNEKHFVILCFQEIDEADKAREKVIMAGMMEPGTTLVRWETREPIAVSPGVRVSRKRAVMTMDQGTVIGGPVGTGPRRMYVSCVNHILGVKIGVGNQHPHRYSIANAKVAKAREAGEHVAMNETEDLVEICDFVFNLGDLNTARYPKLYKTEKIIAGAGTYDQVRIIKSPRKKANSRGGE